MGFVIRVKLCESFCSVGRYRGTLAVASENVSIFHEHLSCYPILGEIATSTISSDELEL